MVRFDKIATGLGTWLIGTVVLYFSASVFPALFNTLDSIFDIGVVVRSILWVGIIFCTFLICVVLPAWQIVTGATEEDNIIDIINGEKVETQVGAFAKIIMAITWFILGLIFVYVSYGNLSVYRDIAVSDPITGAIFWISTIITWVLALLAVPALMLLRNMEHTQ
jgi:hypothetical protein